MSEQFESMKKGLTEILEYVQGDTSKCIVRKRQLNAIPKKEYSKEDIKAIRNTNNLSQRLFADILGVTPRSVEKWEEGKTKPTGTAIRLFQLIEKDNKVIEDLTTKN